MVTHAARLVVVLALASVAGGCPTSSVNCARNSDCEAGHYCSGGSCVSDCTPATVGDDCASGESCNSFGMCVAPPDAGTRDAGPPRLDGGADSPDLRPACVIAGGIDGDADGYCVAGADADCDDADDAVSPGADEVCTPSVAGSVPADENCDGATDEGCGWFFGRPHVVPELVFPRTSGFVDTSGVHVSADGLRIYTSFHEGTRNPALFMARRASRSQPFSAPTPVAVTGTWAGYELTLSEDELTGVFQSNATGDWDLFTMSRTSVTAPFSIARMGSLSSAETELHPTLSRDGLELVFVRGAALLHSVRASASDPFATVEPLTGILGSGVGGPTLSADGRDLFYYVTGPSGRRSIWRAHRDSVRGAAFATADVVTALAPTGVEDFVLPSLSPATRELFMIATRAPFGPITYTHFRVQICRDGPCVEEPVACPGTGRRSPDLFHCYEPLPASIYGDVRATCAARMGGAHLVEVQSGGEHDLVWDAYGGANNVWLALEEAATPNTFAWRSGAPLAYTNWYTGEPGSVPGEACAAMYSPAGVGGQWVDISCAATGVGVCETEVWPTW